MAVKVGDVAPDFQVKDDSGKSRTLAEFRGKKGCPLFLSKRQHARMHERGL